jgi:methanogenic corrinoid protein MtbC1
MVVTLLKGPSDFRLHIILLSGFKMIYLGNNTFFDHFSKFIKTFHVSYPGDAQTQNGTGFSC